MGCHGWCGFAVRSCLIWLLKQASLQSYQSSLHPLCSANLSLPLYSCCTQPSTSPPTQCTCTMHLHLQASIVGNMKQHGLLEGAEQTTFIEYGAGKGYLWCACSYSCLCRLQRLRSQESVSMDSVACPVERVDVLAQRQMGSSTHPSCVQLACLHLPLPLPSLCSHMLASCTPSARKVVMMDVRGFKEKADR